MGSRPSRSAEITSSGNEVPKGVIKENQGVNDSIEVTRDNLLAEGAVIMHSVEEESFAKQLKEHLKNQGVPCCKSMSVGDGFPAREFEAANTYRIIIFILSVKFLTTELLMKKLSAYVKARVKNSKLKIVPLFFMIPPKALKRGTDNEKWKVLEKAKAVWYPELKAIRAINGFNFSEGDDEVNQRDKIVKKICSIVNLQRHPVPWIQGEERMCQELERFINKFKSIEKGIYIAGLYGGVGEGKSTLCMVFCNRKCGNFELKVCYLDFSEGNSFERTKLALQHIIHFPQTYLETLISEGEAEAQLYERLKHQRVLLVLDNVTEESKHEVTKYISADMAENSYILVSARSSNFLTKNFNIDLNSCMPVPSLKEEEAIRILFEETSLEESTLVAGDRVFARLVLQGARPFHPLALKAFGKRLFSKYGSNLSQWVSEKYGSGDGCGSDLDDVFGLLGKDFDKLDVKYCTIFMLLTVYNLPKMSLDKVTEWLAICCNKEVWYIKKAVEYLCHKGFIESFEEEICIDEICAAFAVSKAKEMRKWLWLKGDPSSSLELVPEDGEEFILVRLEPGIYRNPFHIAPRYLGNLSALQLFGVQGIWKLDLSGMDRLRSIIIQDCKDLIAVLGMENLIHVAWIQISRVNPRFELPSLRKLHDLLIIEIKNRDSEVLDRLGDFSQCMYLKKIKVHCSSLLEYPSLKDLRFLEEVEFLFCDKVEAPLDCTECAGLRSIVLDSRCKMAGYKATITATWKDAI